MNQLRARREKKARVKCEADCKSRVAKSLLSWSAALRLFLPALLSFRSAFCGFHLICHVTATPSPPSLAPSSSSPGPTSRKHFMHMLPAPVHLPWPLDFVAVDVCSRFGHFSEHIMQELLRSAGILVRLADASALAWNFSQLLDGSGGCDRSCACLSTRAYSQSAV